MTTDSKTRLGYFFQLTCDTFLTDCLVRYAKCIFRYCYIMLWSLDGCIVMATDNETRLVFWTCYNAWIGAVLKTGVKMRDLSWAIKEEAEMYWKGLSHPTWDHYRACTPRFSLPLHVRLSKENNCFLRTMSQWNRLRQPVVLNHSVEELKAAVSSTISEFMKLENSFTNFQLSCATSDIILNLLKVVSI